MPAESEPWETIARRVGKRLKKEYVLRVYSDEKSARLYNRRFDLGRPVKLVDGKWPAPGAENILIDGKNEKITIYRRGLDYITIQEKVKSVLFETIGGFLTRESEDGNSVEYEFTRKQSM